MRSVFFNKSFSIAIYLVFTFGKSAMAQINPPWVAQYFDQQVLSNPAMVSVPVHTARVSGNFNNQLIGMPGAPVMSNFFAEMNLNELSAVNFQMQQDKGGATSSGRYKLSFSHRIVLGSDIKNVCYGEYCADNELFMGVGLGYGREKLDPSTIKTVSGFEDTFSQSYFVSDMGLAYRYNNFHCQVSVPNLFYNLADNNKAASNVPLWYGSVSYKFYLDAFNSVNIHPKISIRKSSVQRPILDLGFRMGLQQDVLGLLAVYHSNNSCSFGLNWYSVGSNFGVNFYYTALLGVLNTAQYGGLECGISYLIRSDRLLN